MIEREARGTRREKKEERRTTERRKKEGREKEERKKGRRSRERRADERKKRGERGLKKEEGRAMRKVCTRGPLYTRPLLRAEEKGKRK